jgi:CelD/BcsL family acetyltransferase involved in cellulose biosynthesis
MTPSVTASLFTDAPADGSVAADEAPLSLRVFTSFEDAREIASEWDRLVERLDGSLYMTSRWCEIWWRHYGRGRELRLCAVRAGDELVGVVPFCIDRLWVPVGRTRVAKLVGADSTVSLVELPIELAFAERALSLSLERLLVGDRVDMVHLGPCSAATPQLAGVPAAVASLGVVAEVLRDREQGSHTAFELPDGFEAYLGGLSKNQRSNYKRNVNKLSKAFRFEVDVLSSPEEIEGEFDAFIDMHQAQWHAVDKLGHFGDWPGSRAFARDLVHELAQSDQVRLIRLIADGEVVSYYWCFVEGTTYYWRLPARVFGETWDQFSLGRVGLMKMMEVASAEGVTSIEAGTGRYEYKDKLNATTLPLRSIVVGRRTWTSRARARTALAYADLLHLAYYRVWFLRLAPRAKFLRTPLWRSWIRRQF